MLSLLFPFGLAALTALALPALIHLARRDEERRTDFAALRWLRQAPKPRQRLRFDEWPLLITRLLLLALLAMWLARPAWQGEAAPARWLVAAPGVDPAAARAAAPADGEGRWLAPGFPPLADAVPPEAPIASLLRQLDTELPASAALTVLVPERLTGLDGARLQLSRRVDWRVAPASATPLRTATPSSAPAPRLVVHYAPSRAAGLRYLRAAAMAWQAPGKPLAYDAAPAGTELPDRSAVLVWLVPGPLPAEVADWIRAGGTALVDAATEIPDSSKAVTLWTTPAGAPALDGAPLGRGRVLRLRQPLIPGAFPALVEPDFPRRLRDLLAPRPSPSSAHAIDIVPLTGGGRYRPSPRELQPWLAVLLALLFAAERWLATRPGRGVSP